MKPRDWGSLGARLLSIYVAIQSVEFVSRGFSQAFQGGEPIRERVFAILPGLLLAASAIFLWIRGPALATSLLPSEGEPSGSGHPDPFRRALHTGLVFAGLGLAALAISNVVFSGIELLWPRDFPPLALPVPGSPPAPRPPDPLQRQNLIFLIANSAEFLAGLFLAAKAGSIARRLDRDVS